MFDARFSNGATGQQLPTAVTRRQALRSASAGFGYLALASMLGESAGPARAAEASPAPNPLAPRPPHFPVKAKRIIFCFMQGAISQMDTWEVAVQVRSAWSDRNVGVGSLSSSGQTRR